MVSREIDNRMPTAAKLMISDEPPALRNGSVIPVIGTSVTTTADVDERLDAQPPGDPGREQRPERVWRRQRDSDARVRQRGEQGDDDDRADQPEFLADLGEDEVVEGIRDGHQCSAQGRAR